MNAHKKTLVACVFGTILEWYGFVCFGALAPIISQLFFPSNNDLISLLETFSVFAIGFLVRPIGAMVLGGIGDKLGRKQALFMSIMLMGLPTTMMGLLPTYSTIGILAPVLLIILRIMQGFAVSGEHAGVITLISEITPKSKRGYKTSLCFAGVIFGMLLGSLVGAIVTSTMTTEDLTSWGWRIPFLSSFILTIVGFYFRYRSRESPYFEELKARKRLSKKPLRGVFSHYKLNTILVIGIFWVNVAVFYTIFIFFPAYLAKIGGMKVNTLLFINSMNILIMAGLIPVFGMLADKYGYKVIMVIGGLGYILLSYPLLLLLNTKVYMDIFIGQFFFAIINAIFLAPSPALYTRLFPAQVRYTGVAIGLNTSAALFGGTAPIIMTVIMSTTSSDILAGGYIIFSAIIALICVLKTSSIFKSSKTPLNNNPLKDSYA